MRNQLAFSILPLTLAFATLAGAHPGGGAVPCNVPDLADSAESAAGERAPEGLGAGDWTSIRAAHEAWKRTTVVTPDGIRARHPAQQWQSTFDGRGVTIAPDGAAWTWGLALERWGFAGALREVTGLAAGCAEGERVEYAWDGSLSEWYVNGAHGLEHGYTVHRRPQGEGPLVFELTVRGELEPVIDADGRGARFVDGSGAVVLSYAGLSVFDATGRTIDAGLCARSATLCIEVDERGALYPLTIDPTVQQAYLKASNTGADDQFGYSVTVSGNTVVVGAPAESSSATGVNGDGANNSAGGSGAAYVFVRNAGVWSQQAYLKASNTGADDSFGVSVSVSGETVVVGAYWEDSSDTGVNGDGTDNGAFESGAAYVFVRSGTMWSQQAYLKASNTDAGDLFGGSVAVSGDTLVVGANGESSNGVGGEADNSASNSGAAYVFVRSAGVWSQQAYLKASNTGAGDYFGYAVSLSGDTLVVAAPLEDSNSTTIDMGPADNSASAAGAAYVFVRSAGVWSQQAYLKASNTDASDLFGISLSVSSDTLVVGANGEDSNAMGVNGNQASNSASGAGAAYVFVRSGTMWSQEAYLKASNPDVDDFFGFSVSVSGDLVVVGAVWEDSNATGVSGNGADNSAADSGAAYLFGRSAGVWSQQAYLKASNTGGLDQFGYSVSVSGDMVVVGANYEASNATGVNGDQTNNSAVNSGAAYVFLNLPTPAPIAFCLGDGSGSACPCMNPGAPGNGCANSANAAGAHLAASGIWSLSSDTLVLTGTGMPSKSCFYYQGTSMQRGGNGIVFGDGLRCAGGVPLLLGYKLNSAGASSFPGAFDPLISVAGAVTPGTRTYQIVYLDTALAFCPPSTFNGTNGVLVIWAP